MSYNLPVHRRNNALDLAADITIQDVLQDWMKNVTPATRKSYDEALDRFAIFCEMDISEACKRFVKLSRGKGHQLALKFKIWLRDQGNANGTINQRLTALRSFVKACYIAEICTWVLEIKNEPESHKDMRGPGAEGFEKMMQVAATQRATKAARDKAILGLLYYLGLRRDEVATLTLGSIQEGAIMVKRKGVASLVRLTLGEKVSALLDDHIATNHGLDVNDGHDGPLFCNCDRAGKGKGNQLTTKGVYNVVKFLGKKAGLGHVRPHGLRHAAATRALDLTNGDIRSVAKFLSHKSVNTTMRYDDQRKDVAGEMSKRLEDDSNEAKNTSTHD